MGQRFFSRVISTFFCTFAASMTVSTNAALPSGNLGLTTFNDGIARPGNLFQQFVNYYQADAFMDANGHERPVDNSLEMLILATFLGRITEYKMLGAWYGFEVMQPVVLVDADFNPAVKTGNGLGNLSISPVVLQWPQTTLLGRPYFQRFNLQIQLPTGSYTNSRAINPSTNHLTISPHYALTWQFADQWELSSRIHYIWAGKNTDPNPNIAQHSIQPGQAVHFNMSVSKQVGSNWRLGVSSYGLKQIRAERIDGLSRVNAGEQVLALGPALQLGNGKSRLMLNYYHEFSVKSRAEGERIVLRWFQLF